MENKKYDEIKDLDMTEVSGGAQEAAAKEVMQMCDVPELVKQEHTSAAMKKVALEGKAHFKNAAAKAKKGQYRVGSDIVLNSAKKAYSSVLARFEEQEDEQ